MKKINLIYGVHKKHFFLYNKQRMYSLQNGKLINLNETLEEIVLQLKNHLIEYLLRNYNLEWMDDNVENKMYQVLLDFLTPILLGQWWIKS